MIKASELLRFLGALAAGLALLLLIVLRVTSCAPLKTHPAVTPADRQVAQVRAERPDCRAAGWTSAAAINAASLRTLAWAPFGRQEQGWEIYAPMIQHEIGSRCPPDSEAFAQALAAWQQARGVTADGLVTETGFAGLKGEAQSRRDFVRFTSGGTCPDPADEIAQARPEEGYGGKAILLRPGALAAYRRMAAAARAEDPRIGQDPDDLKIFSGYRSPTLDAQRCETEGNCNGVVRARCSAHRTGLAIDVYVGHAPGYGPDSSADPNRLAMTRTPAYQWLLANAARFGFVNYPFEPWHWEWTGEAPSP